MSYLNHSQDTIYALATPFAKSAIAVIRISGSQTKEVLSSLTACPTWIHGKMVHKKIIFNHKIIDFPMISYFNAPISYTGEDSAELYLHGSLAIIEECSLALASFAHVRAAKNGEFTFRAFINGKMDLIEAEALANLIDSETTLQKDMALSHMSGELSEKLQHIKTQCMEILGNIQASIDFADTDDMIIDTVHQSIYALRQDINRLLQSHSGEMIQHGIRLVLVGPVNSGKSTMMNWLSKQKTSIVSSIPGTTRDVVHNTIDFHGYLIHVFDTAGLRVSHDPIEQEGIRRAHEKIQQAHVVCFIIDVTSPQAHEAYANAQQFDLQNQQHRIILLNKCDQASKYIQKDMQKVFLEENFPQAIPISLLYDMGLDSVKQALLEIIKPQESVGITQPRHRELLHQVSQYLKKAETLSNTEIIGEYLKDSLNSLGQLLGYVHHEDILDIIFGKFCIGK